MACSTFTQVPSGFTIDKFKPMPDPICKTKPASFSMGCFWAPDSLFGSIKGVMKTKVGYAGGTTPSNPSYDDMGDFIETVQIQYDPLKITYPELLQVFFSNHNVYESTTYRQYTSAIFYHDKEQQSQATDYMKQLEHTSGKPVVTLLLPFTTFYDAENYHQKYILRRHKDFLLSLSYDDEEIKNSYAASVLNGILGGHISGAEKVKILDLGLSDQQCRYLEACVTLKEGRE